MSFLSDFCLVPTCPKHANKQCIRCVSLFPARSNGAMNNPMFGLKGPKMQKDAKGYDKNFALEFALKDVRFAQALGKEHGVKMDVSSAAQRKLLNSYLSMTLLPIVPT